LKFSFCAFEGVPKLVEGSGFFNVYLIVFLIANKVSGRRYVCHDDRYILNLASETGAIVVSNDNYRELVHDKPEYKKVIEEKILMYTFVNDR